jgi:8-oxo-dGTP pyrophosphatase MutT (NUDIX family)
VTHTVKQIDNLRFMAGIPKTSPLLQATKAFIGRLSKPLHAALLAYQPHAWQMRPQTGVCWYWQEKLLGWMPYERATRLALALPRASLSENILQWSGQGLAADECSAVIQRWLQQEKTAGLITGWRDEAYHCWDGLALPPEPSHAVLFTCERAGFRHMGLTSHAVHTNGFTPEGDVWCGRRSAHKATDPDMLDNLSAGGLAASETIWDNFHKELYEEAGLRMGSEEAIEQVGWIHAARPESVSWHDEVLWVFNAVLLADQKPQNQDGEVAEFIRLTPDECVERIVANEFTKDSVLALLRGLGLKN